MKKLARHLMAACVAPVLLGGVPGQAQAIPADATTTAPGIGFSLPRVGGSLSYALSASELITTGYYGGGVSVGTNFAGDLAYLGKSQRHPFSAVYSGGVLVSNSNQPTTVYQSLAFSQLFTTKHWNFALADIVSYLPQGPLGGLSGIPGVGDLGVDPVAVVPSAGIGILTTYGPRVSNTTSGTASRQLTSRISTQATGYYSIQRFIGDNANLGLNSSTLGASGGVSYQFSARDTLTGSYNYSHFGYSGLPYAFTTQGATADFSRKWSPRLMTDVYAGPQIISGSNNNVLLTGTSTQIAAGASASYLSRTTTYSLSYSRGANNGSGVIPGAFSDSITATARRQFSRDWMVSGTVGFSRTSSLPNLRVLSYSGNAVSFGAQASRRFGRSFSGFATYNLQDQQNSASSSVLGAYNAYHGVYNNFGIGITYSPRNILLGR